MEKIRTSIYIDASVWKRLKEEAAREGVDVSELLERILREYFGEIPVAAEELDFDPVDLGLPASRLIREMRL
ncbi:CopG family transcriptional regulator [Pyrobaculum aerophilum]|uniref:Helix-turn-helix protein, conjectural n=2 Tax=Pyrobaculum aerophilum TaxID=13773 RepID=Q8ZZE8_PYRAE|nr:MULTISPECIES: CopG family transcriptional regulator [Pyrobaculum]AAL62693.1 helix-turn-helix protein, conjectural [Pyrobaculum aerophilum str. IM2]MCX8136635.1 ribbon-helix-helix domain-containing protein [Pyrobaculum aerophilum]HII48241.1 ribbon-helix-helix domain-containing protein [Pyrobaculum aerophilum]